MKVFRHKRNKLRNRLEDKNTPPYSWIRKMTTLLKGSKIYMEEQTRDSQNNPE